MTQATLPEGGAAIDHSIGAMDEGDSGWTVAWAMFHDNERRLWLNGNYTVHSLSRGTADMRVWRDERGWHVDASRCRHTWSGGAYTGTFAFIAVTTVKWA